MAGHPALSVGEGVSTRRTDLDLHLATRSRAEQEAALATILLGDPLTRTALQAARTLDLPDWLIVSGAIYNTVWNALTGRPSGHGIKDIDLFYFDAADRSYEAEDAAIRRAADRFAALPVPVEIRNQARVHLWYRDHFGIDCPAYAASADSLSFFAAKTHAVGVRLRADDTLAIVAPFGLDAIFGLRLVPNPALANAETFAEKAQRAKACWPEIVVEPWPGAG
ncbi:nucleotidyltransferase family protein [Pararhizobium mangrovi]|uniref:Nucleotidyltransferase family protein n=1 Tax=Pararhizobium mangrovi TaxID=2590452 RepID=A0A506U302_9HYPH|nr:nucleotidyltransferase family protein [Pararhizobium mangrovi]TPW28733.1 nucleotidyltransferase family protein [Pararhizobium mangrovi]